MLRPEDFQDTCAGAVPTLKAFIRRDGATPRPPVSPIPFPVQPEQERLRKARQADEDRRCIRRELLRLQSSRLLHDAVGRARKRGYMQGYRAGARWAAVWFTLGGVVMGLAFGAQLAKWGMFAGGAA